MRRSVGASERRYVGGTSMYVGTGVHGSDVTSTLSRLSVDVLDRASVYSIERRCVGGESVYVGTGVRVSFVSTLPYIGGASEHRWYVGTGVGVFCYINTIQVERRYTSAHRWYVGTGVRVSFVTSTLPRWSVGASVERRYRSPCVFCRGACTGRAGFTRRR